MTSLHVIYGFAPPPIKNPGYAYSLTAIQNQETPKLLIAIFAASLCCDFVAHLLNPALF